MKNTCNKLGFSKLSMTQFVSRTSVFSSEMIMIRNNFIVFLKIFFADPTLCCLFKFEFVFLCHNHRLYFCRRLNSLNVFLKSVYKNLCNVFALWLFGIQNGFKFLSTANNIKTKPTWFMLLVSLCVDFVWIILTCLNRFCETLKMAINSNRNSDWILVVFKLEFCAYVTFWFSPSHDFDNIQDVLPTFLSLKGDSNISDKTLFLRDDLKFVNLIID